MHGVRLIDRERGEGVNKKKKKEKVFSASWEVCLVAEGSASLSTLGNLSEAAF